jgi:hypothetical protein
MEYSYDKINDRIHNKINIKLSHDIVPCTTNNIKITKQLLNNDSYHSYNKLKFNIIGQKTRDDAINMLNKYNLTPLNHNIMMSYINGKKYDIAFDNETMIKYINDLNSLKYREDVYESINNLLQNTSDVAQIKTFSRIANSKPPRPQFITLKELRQRNTEHIIVKNCPHCGHKCSSSKEKKYVICGYNDNGYDWEGCGNDWCFRCGKMYCKKWERDELYLPTNRFHNSKCCKKHARLNNKIYPDNYCMCKNIYVCRETDQNYLL